MSTNTAARRGILTIDEEHYHADPAEVPSLSASIAHLLCSQSPAHAKAAHPKLTPQFERKAEEKFDVGTAAHALMLEGRNAVAVIDAPDWRTKAAKEERDLAREQGRIPLLTHTYVQVQEMVAAVRDQLAAHNADPPLFTDGKPEQTLIWDENGVVCRARLDWLRDDHTTIDDLKTTSRSANPEAYSRALFNVGGDVQAAFYLRGVEALQGTVIPCIDFRWAVVETSPPYALSVISPGPDVLTIGRKKVDFALKVWAECLRADEWPGYPTSVCFAELPGYEEARWLERELAA